MHSQYFQKAESVSHETKELIIIILITFEPFDGLIVSIYTLYGGFSGILSYETFLPSHQVRKYDKVFFNNCLSVV